MKDSELSFSIINAASSAIQSMVGIPEAMNIVVQSLHDYKPQNGLEARLVAQSAVLFAQGMRYIRKADEADMLSHSQFYSSYGAKLIRLHNETVETLSRYRRGGEQRVFVQHNVVADKAVVNNFTGVGIPTSSKGETPCPHESAMPKPEPITTSPADSPPWPTADAGSTEASAQAQGQKKANVG